MRTNRKAMHAVGVGMAAAFLSACSDSATAPAPVSPTLVRPSFVVAGTAVDETPTPSEFRVCKFGGVGVFTISRTPAGGGFGTGSTIVTSITIQPGQCYVVVEDDAPSGSGSNVTVTETSPNLIGIFGQRVSTVTGVTTIAQPITNPFTDFINSIHGVVLFFKNHEETGNEGCTPGYWKQDQHFGNWPVPLTTTFADAGFTFGYTGTLLAGLDENGGGIDALARAAAAAFLNALSGDVDYAYASFEVLAIANGTGIYSGLTIEERKDLLDAANNGVGGCPLDRAELD